MTAKKNEPANDSTANSASASTSSASENRNPEVTVVDVDKDVNPTSQSQAGAKSEDNSGGKSQAEPFGENGNSRFELNFKGSELLRAQFPKPFEVAEKVADEWIHDGRFEGLPLGSPLAQYFAAKGLRRAKELEKKVMESPATEKLFTQAFTLGLKAQEIISQVSSKMKK